MRSSRKGWLAAVVPEGIRRPIVPCLVAGLLACTAGVGLEAKDKETRRARREQKERDREQGGTAAPEAAKETPKDAANEPAASEPVKAPDAAKAPDKEKVAHKADETARLGAGDAKVAKTLAPALEAARSSRETLRKLPDYTCTFIKQEQVKKNSLTRQVMSLKFRREPFSVYLKYIDPNPGREVLFVEGRNDGKFHVREASGLLSYMGTISLLPTSNDAMKENRYPITMIGMEKMLDVFITEWEESLKHADTLVQHFPQAKFGELDCQMFEVAHPQQREPLKFHKGRVYFDKKTNLPIRSEQYAFPTKAGREPQLVEEYNYLDVKAVDAPSEKDFDVKNESYGFK
ncbi:MAG: DUF1571 domain-containing protein [Planctomycetia bacterium]|nr:DUF1571 domain-containing protein [Planctomycetia bacterium]